LCLKPSKQANKQTKQEKQNEHIPLSSFTDSHCQDNDHISYAVAADNE
jgi:hypothetical protein